jgi:hypothetical protein
MAQLGARPRFGVNGRHIVHVSANGIETCSHCGAIAWDPHMPQLSKNQRRVYLYIARHPGCVWQDIADHVYADHSDGGPESARTCIATFIHYANKRLADQRIVCTGGSGASYYLIKDPADVSP